MSTQGCPVNPRTCEWKFVGETTGPNAYWCSRCGAIWFAYTSMLSSKKPSIEDIEDFERPREDTRCK